VKYLVLALSALVLTACASSGAEAPSGPPTLVAASGQPAPAQSRFFTDCITQAVAADSVDREANVLRFHCEGETAQRFYERLASYSPRIGAEYEADGATWRFTSPIRENPSFRDFCRRSADARYDCTIVLNIGEFLEE